MSFENAVSSKPSQVRMDKKSNTFVDKHQIMQFP